ncbi:MAG: hypothetical protein KC766_04475, partial [Myxococcales bacterium]|nr:hypothetical protein [Myxococcales bacterium]
MYQSHDVPWRLRRGVEHFQHNHSSLLARTTVEHVAFRISRIATTWSKDVLGRAVVAEQIYCWVFRLKEHDWTSVVLGDPLLLGAGTEIAQFLEGGCAAERLSRELEVPVITFVCSDTTDTMSYSLAADGNRLESLVDMGGEVLFQSRIVDGDRGASESSHQAA